jgi:hypothetical protein
MVDSAGALVSFGQPVANTVRSNSKLATWRIVVAYATYFVLVWAPAAAAPKAELWQRWAAHDRASTITIDHDSWDRFVRTYVARFPDGVNRVAYADVTVADHKLLESYIDKLKAIAISAYNRDEQRAYWINLYNALTVKVVLDHYPVKSIRQIKPTLFSIGPWRRKRITVESVELSLDDIEHRILRPIWRDPRLHYALNCASIGCPNLLERAFTAANSEALLTQAAHAYVNNARGAEVRSNRLVVSSIYKWYREDFGNTDAGVIDHLQRYAEPELSAQLRRITRIAAYRYDWALNDAAQMSNRQLRTRGSLFGFASVSSR